MVVDATEFTAAIPQVVPDVIPNRKRVQACFHSCLYLFSIVIDCVCCLIIGKIRFRTLQLVSEQSQRQKHSTMILDCVLICL